MKTITYISENGKMVKTVTDRPEPTREQMAETARVIRDCARRGRKATRTRDPLPAIDTRAEIAGAIDDGLDVYELFG